MNIDIATLELIKQHRDVLLEKKINEKQLPEQPLQPEHLLYMCNTILKGNRIKVEWSTDKLNRWLGFIQAGMILHGYSTLDKERDIVRQIMYNLPGK